MSGFYFGPLGAMQPVEVSAGVSVASGRGFSELVTTGGVRYAQIGRSAPRTWTVGRLWQNPSWAKLFNYASNGLLGDCWLYDVAKARENMIPARLCSGTDSAVMVDGAPMGGLIAGHEVTVPALVGRVYTVAVWSQAAQGATVAQYRLGSGAMVNISAPEGTGYRQCAASFVPSEDTTITLKIPGTGTSGATIHEGPPRGDFYATAGTPCKVAVQDPQRVLQMLLERDVRSDYEVTLMEVGRPTL